VYISIKFCIDCCFEELKETKPEIEEEETKKQKTKQQLKVAKIAFLFFLSIGLQPLIVKIR